MSSLLQARLVRSWYHKSPWLYLLLPLSLLYGLVSVIRRRLYQSGLLASSQSPVPLIVVGNISVGGTGKTPLVIALVKALQQAGYKPGIISRGYGSQAPQYPFKVTAQCSALQAGDEPLLMARRTGVPVVIDALRSRALTALLASNDCDVVISDDGLQHYALQRDIEIVVVDAARGFGNRWLLPAGPLRETVSRLQAVDFIVANGTNSESLAAMPTTTAAVYSMQLKPAMLHSTAQDKTLSMDNWPYSKTVHAVAGIGNPQRFYATLQQLGFSVIAHSFDDHHQFVGADIDFADDLPVIMTEKDAVKIAALATPVNSWYLPVDASIDAGFYKGLIDRVQHLSSQQSKQSIKS